MEMTAERVLAGSMIAMLALGMAAQLMQQAGGRCAKLSPFIIIGLLLILSVSVMMMLSAQLSTTQDWRVAADTPAG